MFKCGDIIYIENYYDEGGILVEGHPFIVVHDEHGEIEGLRFDFFGCFMSSIWDEEHEKEVKKNKNNLIVDVEDGVVNRSYIKAEVLTYFKKTKTRFFKVGHIDDDAYDVLIDLINQLQKDDALTDNVRNILS
jgi:hypothetical protein